MTWCTKSLWATTSVRDRTWCVSTRTSNPNTSAGSSVRAAVIMTTSIRLLMFGTGCSECPGRRGVADDRLPLAGFQGVAASLFWTSWLLIEICAWSLFMELLAGRPRG